MFERNNNSDNNANTEHVEPAQTSKNNTESVNMVSKGTEIIGKLITQSNIRIAGAVDGEVKVEGQVIVASSGHVEGNINAINADIAGRVEGEVHVEGKLTLRESAVVECDIYTQKLEVEEGATLTGGCYMHDHQTKNADKAKGKAKKGKPSNKKKETSKNKEKVNA